RRASQHVRWTVAPACSFDPHTSRAPGIRSRLPPPCPAGQRSTALLYWGLDITPNRVYSRVIVVYAAVFLIKVKVSKSRLVSDDLHRAVVQTITDCQNATTDARHAAGTAHIMLRVLLASWRAMET
ncbi:uncharacterized protein L969DRAFT_41595, partial [Mixia osmundae IAM 14324]|uniref:uncharacterized protein n=1 Tax=Mixia osmundae (strain CBS 9802 / IAM 14324 / JCM 22182 / KY 12970) TaxID=764103 RepID=UPI0004A5481E